MDILFLGAAGTVTGSRYLVGAGDRRILVDCGLFQGYKHLRERNWEPFPVDPSSIDAVILTHAHIDHSGYLPALVRGGFKGRIHATAATRDLCHFLLMDSAKLQEEEAEYANRKGFSKHRPALPLYGEKDAVLALSRFDPAPLETDVDLGGGASFRLKQAGHILGAAMVALTSGGRSALFSGDLGRSNDPILRAPAQVKRADALVLESTYGNRPHEDRDPAQQLAAAIQRTVARGGTVLIPSFAVGRAQLVLYHLYRLRQSGEIPDIPVFVNSPMATDAGRLLCEHADEHRLGPEECRRACAAATYINSVDESKALDRRTDPRIIISASGMATGGRVLHHLKTLLPDERNTVLFVGYQAGGTRGSSLVQGASSVKIHGAFVPVRAEVASVHGLSAHADPEEMLAWLRGFEQPPGQTYLTHGEPDAAEALRARISHELGWSCRVAQWKERVEV